MATPYYAARSNEFGYANYEIVPAPQIAANPLTALSNQFTTELGLTEQQKRAIVPILQQEIKQLGGLKKDTKLSGLQKVEELRKLSVSFDEKISPLLNPGSAEEIPGHARADAAADGRGGRKGKAKEKVEAQLTRRCTSWR